MKYLSTMSNFLVKITFATSLLMSSDCVHGFLPPAVETGLPSTFSLDKSRLRRGGVEPVKYITGDADTSATTATTNPSSKLLEMDLRLSPKKSFHRPDHKNVCSQTGVTLSRYMMEMERLNPELEEVESIFTGIQVACKAISKLVRTANLESLTGTQDGGGSINVQGEEQKKMDVLANDVLKNALKWTGHMRTLASEEEDTPVTSQPSDNHPDVIIDQGGSYIAVFDPLDGSSNIDAAIPVGTIFGIFKHDDACKVGDEDVCLSDVLQPGRNLVAAGYCLYSSSTSLVFTLGDGVHGFTLDEGLGEFVMTHPNMKMPGRGKIYSFNEGNRWDWDQPLQNYITALQQGRGETQTRYSGRYVGSMVADIHRTLQYGGIFGYPADKKNTEGKLRLVYEASPMAFLIEQAGGIATTGSETITDIEPEDVHQRVPCFMGSRDDMNELASYYKSNRTRAALESPLWAAKANRILRNPRGSAFIYDRMPAIPK